MISSVGKPFVYTCTTVWVSASGAANPAYPCHFQCNDGHGHILMHGIFDVLRLYCFASMDTQYATARYLAFAV